MPSRHSCGSSPDGAERGKVCCLSSDVCAAWLALFCSYFPCSLSLQERGALRAGRCGSFDCVEEEEDGGRSLPFLLASTTCLQRGADGRPKSAPGTAPAQAAAAQRRQRGSSSTSSRSRPRTLSSPSARCGSSVEGPGLRSSQLDSAPSPSPLAVTTGASRPSLLLLVPTISPRPDTPSPLRDSHRSATPAPRPRHLARPRPAHRDRPRLQASHLLARRASPGASTLHGLSPDPVLQADHALAPQLRPLELAARRLANSPSSLASRAEPRSLSTETRLSSRHRCARVEQPDSLDPLPRRERASTSARLGNRPCLVGWTSRSLGFHLASRPSSRRHSYDRDDGTSTPHELPPASCSASPRRPLLADRVHHFVVPLAHRAVPPSRHRPQR